MTQAQRIKAALLAHHQGITQLDFQGPHVIDGGAPILRVAARIHDLGLAGFPIIDGGERQGCKLYRLDHDKYLAQQAERSRALYESEHQASLDVSEADFDPPKERPRLTADGLREMDTAENVQADQELRGVRPPAYNLTDGEWM